MARINIIKATITGRLGEIVGSSWKGVNYIKRFTPPTNPKTELQQTHRSVFAFLGSMASSLAEPLLNKYMYPAPRKMSRMNACLKENSRYIKIGEINLGRLNLYPPSMDRDFSLVIRTPSIEERGSFWTELTIELSAISKLPQASKSGCLSNMPP
jgi:hypothetical protein